MGTPWFQPNQYGFQWGAYHCCLPLHPPTPSHGHWWVQYNPQPREGRRRTAKPECTHSNSCHLGIFHGYCCGLNQSIVQLVLSIHCLEAIQFMPPFLPMGRYVSSVWTEYPTIPSRDAWIYSWNGEGDKGTQTGLRSHGTSCWESSEIIKTGHPVIKVGTVVVATTE